MPSLIPGLRLFCARPLRAAHLLLVSTHFPLSQRPPRRARQPNPRLAEIYDAFKGAIHEFAYQAAYCCVYPIKVNQQRHVVEEILDFGKPYHFGLEAGSKPELLAVLAVTNGGDTPIICNGFKDDEFIQMTMLARKIGKNVIPVVEKFTEVEAIVRYAEELRVRPDAKLL